MRFRSIRPSLNSSSRALWRNMFVPASALFRKKVAFSRRFERQRICANGLLAETGSAKVHLNFYTRQLVGKIGRRLSTNGATNVSPISMNFALHEPLRVARARQGRNVPGSISRWDAVDQNCGHLLHRPPGKCFLSSIRDPKAALAPARSRRTRRRRRAAQARGRDRCVILRRTCRGCAEPVRTHVAGDGARPPRTCGKSSGRWDLRSANVGTLGAPTPE